MATYQDAITAMETSGAWMTSERTELASIYTEIGTGATSGEWQNIVYDIGDATAIISDISTQEYGKQPSELTDAEILEIRKELLETGNLFILYRFANITNIGKIIEETWDVEENRYKFTLIDADETAPALFQVAILTYDTSAGVPDVFPSVTAAHGDYGAHTAILSAVLIPDVVVQGVRYGWYSANDEGGTLLKAGDVLPLTEENPDWGTFAEGKLYAGVAREEVSVQMRTKQRINGAIQEFLVYPKTRGGGGGGGSQIVEWDGNPSGLAEVAEACLALWESGIVPSVRLESDTYMGYFYNDSVGVEMSFVYRHYTTDETDEVITGEDVTVLTLLYNGTEWTEAWREGYFTASR